MSTSVFPQDAPASPGDPGMLLLSLEAPGRSSSYGGDWKHSGGESIPFVGRNCPKRMEDKVQLIIYFHELMEIFPGACQDQRAPSFYLFTRMRWEKGMEGGEELNDGVC